MKAKITPELIEEMNELYLEIKTYAGVSRALGGSPSPSTVKKYINPDYIGKDQLIITKFETKDLPQFRPELFIKIKNWGDLCVLTKEEEGEMERLWAEISL